MKGHKAGCVKNVMDLGGIREWGKYNTNLINKIAKELTKNFKATKIVNGIIVVLSLMTGYSGGIHMVLPDLHVIS